MAKNDQRIAKNLQKFAHLLGEGLKDAKGVKYDFDDKVSRHHMFWVKNRDDEDTAINIMPGNVIIDKIRDDAYDLDYIGTDRDLALVRKKDVHTGELVFVDDDELTKPQRDVKAKLQKIFKQQEEQLEEGKRRKLERNGVFEAV